MPAINTGGDGLELHMWKPTPVDSESENAPHFIDVSGFPNREWNGRYKSTTHIRSGMNVFSKGGLSLKFENFNGEDNANNADRWHLYEANKGIVAWRCAHISSNPQAEMKNPWRTTGTNDAVPSAR
jgi:hypothetical protein